MQNLSFSLHSWHYESAAEATSLLSSVASLAITWKGINALSSHLKKEKEKEKTSTLPYYAPNNTAGTAEQLEIPNILI